MVNRVTNWRSTSLGEPSRRALPLAVTMIGPTSPALVSPLSSTWEWYIHNTEEGSFGPGPERAGTCHTCRTRPPGGAALELGEAGVGVFAVQRLDVHMADPVGSLLDEDVLGLPEGSAGDVVAAQRGVVPADLVGGDVIGPGSTPAGRLAPGCHQAEQDHQPSQHPNTPQPKIGRAHV